VSWFKAITGFPELGYSETKRRLRVVDGKLLSDVGGQGYSVGRLETSALSELQQRTANAKPAGTTKVSIVQGDVRKLHSDAENAGALFQVASQFNLLEMVSYQVSPEEGVTRYETDRTQGPACAIAAGAGTIYRNYLLPFPDGSIGQTREHQIDCLRELGHALGNEQSRLWTMKNGYSLFTDEGLRSVDDRLAAASGEKLDELRSLLRIGLHWDVDVTDVRPGHAVSQAYCSALPVSYNSGLGPTSKWNRFATLVLEAAYEATLRAGLLNAEARKSNVVYLTRLGGGAFGNKTDWIHDAMRRAFRLSEDWGLDLRIVSYGKPDAELVKLVDSFR
jgi:hypothetical protein